LQNYFNYFTEIEEHFQRRRGSLTLLSTLDWALIETWREAGIPLQAVLQGIDAAFDKYDARKSKSRIRKINGLAYCAQAVIEAVDAMQEAAVGAVPSKPDPAQQGFEQERIAAHLGSAAQQLRIAPSFAEIAGRLQNLSDEVRSNPPNIEELEKSLTVLEEKLFAVVLTTTPEADLLQVREHAARELAPYRSRMSALQIRQIEQQFLHKRLLEKLNLPRLSLFYMSQA
jgi:hypothetical protein